MHNKGLDANEHERQLERICYTNRVITGFRGQYKGEDTKCVIATAHFVDRNQSRIRILWHEFAHAAFFSSQSYREMIQKFWREDITLMDRRFFTILMKDLGYNPTDEYLAVNEFMAYFLEVTGINVEDYISQSRSDLTATDEKSVLTNFSRDRIVLVVYEQ